MLALSNYQKYKNVYFITCAYLCIILMLSFSISVKTQKLSQKKFVILHQWTKLEMTLPTEATADQQGQQQQQQQPKQEQQQQQQQPKQENTTQQRNSYEAIAVDLDVEYGDDGYHRTFLTIPRLTAGIPYSLAIVVDEDNATLLNPRVKAYPNYDMHSGLGRNCSQFITSAIRTFIDECWRLWVVDSGQINSMQYCPPQILAFDLVSDKLLHRYQLPKQVYTPNLSVFTALFVDVGESEPRAECRDTMVYVADPWGFGLIVYDVLAAKSWRIQHKTMRPDIPPVHVDAMSNGIFTVSISPKFISQDRYVYFHALNSHKEIRVNLEIINNRTLWIKNKSTTTNASSIDSYFEVLGNRGTQCESEIIDHEGNLYCSLMNSNAIISWKEGTSDYNAQNLKVVAHHPKILKFITGLKVNRNSAEEDELWALSNDPKLFIGSPLKPDISFQIVGCRTHDLHVQDRDCTVALTKYKPKRR